MNNDSISHSSSPSYRRSSVTSNNSSASKKHEEDLINAYEAEEERIINTLSRKLEQLREEKISIERAHEEESEAQVNRLTRELATLRLQAQQQSQFNGSSAVSSNGAESSDGANSPVAVPAYVHSPSVLDPSAEVLRAALMKENEILRERLGDVEKDYSRVTRLNEIYREELISHRRRLGLPVDNLIGLSSATDPYSQPLHRRASSSSSPVASMVSLPTLQGRPSSTTHSVPIPRPSSQVRRAYNVVPSISETPLSRSPSSAESPSASPVLFTHPESYVSHATHLTTPASSTSPDYNLFVPYPPGNVRSHTLSYPSVPPPSLSSSLGSPIVTPNSVPSPVAARDGWGTGGAGVGGGVGGGGPPSPLALAAMHGASAGIHRSDSMREDRDRRVADAGNLHEYRRSRRPSFRVAETGTLVPRSRAASTTEPPAPQSSGSVENGSGSTSTSVLPSLDKTAE